MNVKAKNTIRAIGLIIGLFFCAKSTFSQLYSNIKFDHYVSEDGLSQVSVYSIFQDSQGFIWIGTEDGLNRFDGHKFMIFRHEPDNPYSISENTIYDIFEDKEGFLWVATANGLNRLNRKTLHFKHYFANSEKPYTLSHSNIGSFLQDSQGRYWVGTNGGGINLFEKSTNRFFQFPSYRFIQSQLKRASVPEIVEDSQQNIWFCTSKGLGYFRMKDQLFTLFQHNPDAPASIPSNNVRDIAEAPDGKLWIVTDKGFCYYNPENKSFNTFYNADSSHWFTENYWAVFVDKNGMVWLGTDKKGLVLYSPEKQQFVSYQESSSFSNGISNNEVREIYQDRTETIWIGTYIGGVNKVRALSLEFLHYNHSDSNPESLSNNTVFPILESRHLPGKVWVGTWSGGLNLLDRNTDKFTHYFNQPENPNSLGSNTVLSLEETAEGLWIGTSQGGLNFLSFDEIKAQNTNAVFERYQHNSAESHSLSNNNVWAIEEDVKNTDVLWIGTYGGLNKFEKSTGHFESYSFAQNGNPGCNEIWHIHQNTKQPEILWLGSRGGLVRFNTVSEKYEIFTANRSNSNSLSHNEIWTIYEDLNGFFWIGTNGGGLNKFNPETGEFQVFREADGLPNDVVYGILPENATFIWMSTIKGLAKFNVRTEKFVHVYDHSDGLQDAEFNACAYHKGQNGELYFGGINGFNIINPGELRPNPYPPQAVITGFYLFNEAVESGNDSPLTQNISQTQLIILDYTQNYFSFEFSALHFENPERNRCAYKMENIDRNWIYVSADRNFATYTNLRPGTYRFRVKALSSSNVWGEETSITIKIIPPFWETKLFIVWVVLLAFTIILLFFKLRERKLERDKLRLEQKVAIRTAEIEQQKCEIAEQRDEIELQRDSIRQQKDEYQMLNATKDKFFSILAHDLRNPFNTLLNTSLLLKHRIEALDTQQIIRSEVEQLHQSAKDAYNLLENLLNWARSQTDKIELKAQKLDIKQIAEENISLFSVTANNKDIKLMSKVPDYSLAWADFNTVNTIVRNLVSNAIKFTPRGGKIILWAQQKGEDLIFSVEDNGIGIEKETREKLFRIDISVSTQGTSFEKGTGLGLILCKEFVEKNGGKIWIKDSRFDTGSLFQFSLPLFSEKANKALLREIEVEIGKEQNAQQPLNRQESLKISSELLQILTNEYKELIEYVRQKNRIRDILKTGERLKNLGSYYNVPAIQEYGIKLETNAKNFDIEAINYELNRYESIIEQLISS